jgi:Spy/CpxP family protein refolding chaperone
MKSARPLYCLVLAAALAAPTFVVHAADAPPPATRPARGFRPGGPGGPRDPGQMLKMQRQRLEELNLNDDQKKKLDEIYASAEGDFKKALEETRDASPQERREKIGPILFGVREKVMGVLTDEQKQKFREMGPGFGGRGGPGGPGGMNQVGRLRENLDKLDLTAEQKPKVAAVLDDAQKKGDALRAEMENGNADRQQLMDKGMQIRDEVRTKLDEILTPEQKEKLRGIMQQEGPGPGGPGGRRFGRPGAATRPAR